MQIRPADITDLPVMEALYERSRIFMAANGNPAQWGTSGPSRAQLKSDLARHCSYLCTEGDEVIAAFMYRFGHDPLYDRIDGRWLNGDPYGVMHRMAAGGSHRGAGTFCLDWCWRQCGNLRVDTHRDNLPMQGLFGKLGFVYCGITWAEDGTERLAFQKAG